MDQVIAHQAYYADVRTTRINSADVAQMLVSSHSSAIILYRLAPSTRSYFPAIFLLDVPPPHDKPRSADGAYRVTVSHACPRMLV